MSQIIDNGIVIIEFYLSLISCATALTINQRPGATFFKSSMDHASEFWNWWMGLCPIIFREDPLLSNSISMAWTKKLSSLPFQSERRLKKYWPLFWNFVDNNSMKSGLRWICRTTWIQKIGRETPRRLAPPLI